MTRLVLPVDGLQTPIADRSGDSNHPDAIAQLVRVFAILRRRWLVIAATVALSLAAAALALRFIAPIWEASTSVVLHMTGPQVLDKVQGVSEDAESRVLGYKEYYQTQRMIMQSRTVAERALATLGLEHDPVFLGVDHLETEQERADAAAEIDPVSRLQEMVGIEEVRNSRIVRITAEYPDPEIARDIANAVTDAYFEHVQSSRSRLGEEAKQSIAGERDKAETRVLEAERQLEVFKVGNNITSVSLADRQNVITQDILTLSTQVKQAEAERIRLETMLVQVKALRATDPLAAASLVPGDRRSTLEELRRQKDEAEAELRTVDQEFGPKHENHRKATSRLEVIEKNIDAEVGRLIGTLQSQVNAALATEGKLEAALGREQKRALDLTSLEREYRAIERDARSAEEDYLLVARRDTEIGLTNRVEAEGIEILDRASIPSEPVYPRSELMLAIAAVVGFGLGSLLALSIDFRDHRIRGLVDLERGLTGFGIPVLGQLPMLPADNRFGPGNARAQRRQRDLYTHLFPQSLMAERCRGIRTSIAFVQGAAPVKTIMITSPNSSEGKSSTAVNLALSFCQSKKRVVLVDGDMRRPRIHQVFGEPLDRNAAGLAGVLAGRASLDEAVVRAPGDDSPESLWLLPCGAIPEHPAELLDSADFRRVVGDLRERFDIVIIDSPPVLPVTDPLIVARVVDGVVVVGRCEQTTRGDMHRTLSQLAQGDANVLGVVLNEVSARQDGYDYNPAYYTYRAKETGTDPS